MNKEDKPDRYFQARAKDIVDSLFDAKLFQEKVTRDDMNAVENWIAEEFQDIKQSQKKHLELLERIKHLTP